MLYIHFLKEHKQASMDHYKTIPTFLWHLRYLSSSFDYFYTTMKIHAIAI